MPVTKLMNWKGKLEVLIVEIEKCEVRCGNCPLKNTSQANGSYRLGYTSGILEA